MPFLRLSHTNFTWERMVWHGVYAKRPQQLGVACYRCSPRVDMPARAAHATQRRVVRRAGSSSPMMGLRNSKTGSVITSHAPSHRTCLTCHALAFCASPRTEVLSMTHSLLTTYRIGWQDGCDAARAQLLYQGASHAGRARVYGSRRADVGRDSAHAGQQVCSMPTMRDSSALAPARSVLHPHSRCPCCKDTFFAPGAAIQRR